MEEMQKTITETSQKAQEAATEYDSKLKAAEQRELELRRSIDVLEKQKSELEDQLQKK